MLTKAETEARCGFPIPDEIWNFHPWGHRILIKRMERETMYGSLHIPDTAQQETTVGVVVRVGDRVGLLDGQPGQASIHQLIQDDLPEGLIGTVVTFGQWSGGVVFKSPKAKISGNEYDDAEWLLCQAVDIWGHNTGPEAQKEKENVLRNDS